MKNRETKLLGTGTTATQANNAVTLSPSSDSRQQAHRPQPHQQPEPTTHWTARRPTHTTSHMLATTSEEKPKGHAPAKKKTFRQHTNQRRHHRKQDIVQRKQAEGLRKREKKQPLDRKLTHNFRIKHQR